jgi:DNA invertase Pin-like site-specific DNA recombinase
VVPEERRTMKFAKALSYSYLRFSHPDQAKGDSLRRQTELRDAWIARSGIDLDESLTLEDKGVSGYTGEHRSNPDRYALASFVALVKGGRITRGSYLIVESMDRLSREDIMPALSLVLDLVQSGIRIVQLLPAEIVYDENANPMQMMMMIMELSRGHSESAMKSERVGGAWREKKRRAAENGEPLTARAPAWLRLVDCKWKIDQHAAEAVRRVYRMAIDGYGIIALTRKLNTEQADSIGRLEYWARSSVAKLLCNRAVIGEYQPYKGRGSKRQPDGRPIPGYYPAIITEQEFFAARAALASRKNKAGRIPREHVNVFSGLLHDALNGGMIHMEDKGKRGGRRLVSYFAAHGIAKGVNTSFPFPTFERAILACLREIDPASILPSDDKATDEILEVSGRLVELEAEIERVKNRLQARYSDAVADVLERHETESKDLNARLAKLREKAAAPLSAAWSEYGTLLDVVDAAPDPEESRVRIRAALRRIVEGFRCLFVGRDSWRLAAVQAWFIGGVHREFLILHRPAIGGAVGSREAQWWARSLAEATGQGALDLRRKRDVLALTKMLSKVDIDMLVDAMAASATGR